MGRFDLRLGTGSRKLLVHALCLKAMFGYDVAQRRLMGRELLAVSFQDAGCSLVSECWVQSRFRMLGAVSFQTAGCVGWIGFFGTFLRVASRHAASFRTDT